MVKYCLIGFHGCGSDTFINLFKTFSSDYAFVDYEKGSSISKSIKNINGSNLILNYILKNNEIHDEHFFRDLTKLNFKIIYIDRNYIDVFIENFNKNNAKNAVTLNIKEVYKIINDRIETYCFLNENINKLYFTSYERLFKGKTKLEMINNLNNLFNTINNKLNVKYLVYDSKKDTQIENKIIPSNIYNKIICKYPNVVEYYEQNIKFNIDYSVTTTIVNTEYFLKKNSNIETYLNKKNYIFMCEGKIIITVFAGNDAENETVNDESLFIKFEDYNYNNELNKIYELYSNNVSLIKKNSTPKINIVDDAFIIHLDSNYERNAYVKNSFNLFKNLYFVKAVDYKENDDVFNLCNYFIYRNFYNEKLYNLNIGITYSFGSICLALSNLILMKYCKKNNIEKYFILEDDIILNKNLTDIKHYYDLLPSNVDISYWGIKQSFDITLNYINEKWYRKNKLSWGTHSHILHNSKTTDKLIEQYSSFETSIDCYDFSETTCLVSTKNFFICDEYNIKSDIKTDERIIKEHSFTNNWNYKLDDYHFLKKNNFVIFNDDYKKSDSTWCNFVKAVNLNANENLICNYNTNNTDAESLVFFDFIDREFGWECSKFERLYPNGVPFNWGGIIHHPFNLESYWGKNLCVNDYLRLPYVKKCLNKCKFLIVLSNQLKSDILNSNLLDDQNIKIHVIYHITPKIQLKKGYEFKMSNIKFLTFVGWSFRNLKLFCNINSPFKKKFIPGTTNDEQEERFNKILNIQTNNIGLNDILVENFTTYENYLNNLKNSIIFVDFDGVSANNTVTECIHNNIPIIIPDLEATRFYLGSEYPLYFKNESDIINILNDHYRIESAHYYLKNMDKIKFTQTYNILSILDIIDNQNIKN
jgi:hypothetical protein